MAKKAPAAKPASKSEVFANIATTTGLTKKQVSSVFEALTAEIGKALGKKGSGVFQVPGLCKILRKDIPAKPAQKNVLNRFTGQVGDVPAKPARKSVRVRPLKGLKSMV
jgi:nucleoid DNA-binding protein